jgi:S-adenosylmethionine hydrolase
MTVITLLTDFGLNDGYPGVMKGVIWKIAPGVHIADISHTIEPQNIHQGALILARTAPFFPVGTIHVAVIDPGVGTQRRPIGLRLGEHFFIGPDNGLFTLVIERADANHAPIEIVHLDKPEYWLPEISPVFHGRDIFSPCAAHLALGVPLTDLGTLINDPIRLDFPRPTSIPGGGLKGQIIYIDHFGNLSTNLQASYLKNMHQVHLTIKGEQIIGLESTYGERPAGTLVALIDSDDLLAISLVNGSAEEFLDAHIGDIIEVHDSSDMNYH